MTTQICDHCGKMISVNGGTCYRVMVRYSGTKEVVYDFCNNCCVEFNQVVYDFIKQPKEVPDNETV